MKPVIFFYLTDRCTIRSRLPGGPRRDSREEFPAPSAAPGRGDPGAWPRPALRPSSRACGLAAWLVLALSLSPARAAAGDVYRSVDADGNVSFGDRPIDDRAEPVHVPAPRRAGTDVYEQHRRTARAVEAYASERRERAQLRAERAEEVRERKRRCAVARDEQSRIETAAHLYYRDDEGNKRVIDGAEYDAVIEHARNAVESWCS